MKQHEFIWMANNVHAGKLVQGQDGLTAITLRDNILLVHNYKKKDQMTIVFNDSKSQFMIPTKKELEAIFRLHLENKNLMEILNRYCNDHLTKLN